MLFREEQHKVDLQDTKEFWDRDYVVYDDTASLPNDYDASQDRMVEVINEWCHKFDVSIGANILEAGCGGGRILMIWNACNKKYAWNFHLEGIDHSPKAIEIAKQRLPEVKFCVMGIEEINFKNKYDVIFTHTFLQHNSDWKQDRIYPKIHRALRKDGLFWLINEKTFSTWEDGKITNPFYCDDRGSAGTAAWWIQRIASFGFELLAYHKSSYTFRRI